uniref:Dynein heavy chain coiled coil stalk domain-containing protein n=1 Tax=Neobodo designis TaxID=312471 RepID=A0A7S1L6C5_NEODS|mmetsp:Transcript_157/g.599  ORF Transcript_157/g.599 Transcript_157/m.599 type:complete len:331 (+) Transcript_157:93-1085(+)|eukprot:CAMPEP_0174850974 /NCGR_PEP_ID=MMETSP1114-20130205/21237_1 /TAXON_ID=312471 /ORGANISM="Neobodo designis, Strain CCAP 1951/1" /LENGTH=330 /DNA_ID=CAMNT_0016085471 /DNA_START=98 /DNA_END=1090 /DNA_ORIENTATION=+
MAESAYLKDELGPVLAKGLAAVAVARPQDPVEYLGLWLLHHLQKKEAKAAEIERAKVLESEREEWAAARAVREKQATAVIQREWRSHVSALNEAQRREAELKEAFAAIEEIADEKFPEEAPAEGDKTPQEAQTEADRLAAAAAYGKSTLYIAELDKSVISQFKLIPGTNHSAVTTLRCVMYLMGMRPKQVDSWDKIRTLIKPYPFSVFIKQFQPCGNPLERKRKITRVRRLLTTVHDDAVKDAGTALYAVFAWLQALTQYREARDEHIKAKRAAGKEVEEELDEEEEAEDEEKDADEEVVKAAELEAKRQAELEAAEEAAAAEGDDAAEE